MKIRFLHLLRMVLTMTLLALVAWWVDWHRALDSLKRLTPAVLALAGVFVLVYLAFKTVKWRLLLRAGGIACGLWPAMKSLLAGITLSIFTPMNTGEVGRVFYLPAGRRSTMAGLVVVDKLLDFAAVLIFAIPGTLILFGIEAAVIPTSGAVAVFLFLFAGRSGIGMIRRQRWLGRFRLKAVRTALGLARLRGITVFQGLCVALCAFFMVYLLYYVLLKVMVSGSPPRFSAVLLVCPMVMAGRLLPVTFSGLGMREGIAALLFPRIGVSMDVAVQVTFLVFLLTSALPAVAGAFVRPGGRRSGPVSGSSKRGHGGGRAGALLLSLLTMAAVVTVPVVLPLLAGSIVGGYDAFAVERHDAAKVHPDLKIPPQFFPRFRENEPVELVVDGYRFWIAGDRDEALALFEEASGMDPDNTQALKLLAHVYLEMNRLDAARSAITRANEIFRHDAWTYRLLSRLSHMEGDMAAALKTAKKARKLNKMEVDHILWLAQLYQEAGDEDEVLKLLDKALDLDPHNAELHLDLARMYETRGKIKRALAEYAETVRRDPSRCDVMVTLVERYHERGKEKEFLRWLERALKCDDRLNFRDRLEPFRDLAPPKWYEIETPEDAETAEGGEEPAEQTAAGPEESPAAGGEPAEEKAEDESEDMDDAQPPAEEVP